MNNTISTELKSKMEALADFCEKNKIPVFVACWEPPEETKTTDEKTPTGRPKKVFIDDGYRYEYVSPYRLHLTADDVSGDKNRFPMFLGAIMGFDRESYKR